MLDNISRVYLKQSGVKGSDYINASYIDVSSQSYYDSVEVLIIRSSFSYTHTRLLVELYIDLVLPRYMIGLSVCLSVCLFKHVH